MCVFVFVFVVCGKKSEQLNEPNERTNECASERVLHRGEQFCAFAIYIGFRFVFRL